MHEWIIAEGIAEIIKKKNLKNVKIHIGELQGIDKEILEFSLKRMVNCRFEIVIDKALLKCNICGKEWEPRVTGRKDEVIHFLPEAIFSIESCPNCGSKDFEIIGGRNIWIEC